MDKDIVFFVTDWIAASDLVYNSDWAQPPTIIKVLEIFNVDLRIWDGTLSSHNAASLNQIQTMKMHQYVLREHKAPIQRE